MKGLLERLNDEVLVCDGAIGTMLMDRGLPAGVSSEKWGVDNRDILYSIHKAYVDAGSDMIITNTFGANSVKLARLGLKESSGDINKRAVEIAREAAGRELYVIGDIGPTGDYLSPAGNLTQQQMSDTFADQAKALAGSGVDAIILETMSDLKELKAAIIAVKENTKVPLIASMTFCKIDGIGFRTTSGISIPQFVNEALMTGSDVIGVNCSLRIGDIIPLVAEIRSLCGSFIMAEPDAGMPGLVGDRTIYEQSCEEFCGSVRDLIEAGADIIGGCCGTTPEHIRGIKKVINNLN